MLKAVLDIDDDIVFGVGKAVRTAGIKLNFVTGFFEIVRIAPRIIGNFINDFAIIGCIDESFEILGEFFVIQTISLAVRFEGFQLCFGEPIISFICLTDDVPADQSHDGDHQGDDDHDFDKGHTFSEGFILLCIGECLLNIFEHGLFSLG
jgi:hypothetical protein